MPTAVAKGAMRVGHFHGILSGGWSLLEVVGESTVAVGKGAEGALDAP